MALQFSEVYSAELEQIRQRRLHQWHSEHGAPGQVAAAPDGDAAPAPEETTHITEGVPEDARAVDDQITDPLILGWCISSRPSLKTKIPISGNTR
jgi:hypothetical protein